MFSSAISSVNQSKPLQSYDSVASTNKVAPGFTKGGSFWERLFGLK